MRLILVMMALTGLLTACTKNSVDSRALSISETSSVTLRQTESFISETELLNLWFDERFEERLSRSPIWMTVLGRKGKYDQIDDLSEAEQDSELQRRAAMVAELTSEFDYSILSDDAKISYDIWIYQYEIARIMAAFRRNDYIFTQMNGAQSELPVFLINYHKVDDVSDISNGIQLDSSGLTSKKGTHHG